VFPFTSVQKKCYKVSTENGIRTMALYNTADIKQDLDIENSPFVSPKGYTAADFDMHTNAANTETAFHNETDELSGYNTTSSTDTATSGNNVRLT
jgi:hypothetical protein